MKNLLLIPLLVLSFQGYGQQTENTDKQQIEAVVNQFFDALEKKDTLLLQSATMPKAQIWVRRTNKTPASATMRFVEDDIKRLNGGRPVKEIGLDFDINIHNGVAVAWVPYEFWVEGEFSHCGIDIFTLFEIEDVWKIVSIAYSIEKESCDQLPVAR